MAKTIEERVNEFFTDPKHSEQAEFMKAAVKKVIGDIANEEEEEKKKKKKQKKEPSFFDGLFGRDTNDEDSD